MSLHKDDEPPGDTRECPVCFESPRGTERTLSCGHAFCHDCLVKLLLSIQVEGQTRHTLACPVCRHLTFIRKRQNEPPALAEGKGEPEEDAERGGQTLEVPAGTPLTRLDDDSDEAAPAAASLSGRVRRFFCGDSEGPHRPRLVRPSPRGSSEVFVIDARGRPMTEDDAFGVVLTAVRRPRRRGRRLCSTARCLAVLLSAFTTMALVAAVLPWILLA
ncbi:RING finger protein 222 [Hippocampus comes]|uniref:RING finger protein 222 n=1 Tax=Hippocampus comes TaxID=109280 RepID=UPI00094F20AC|nr:PREDICTED: RING finger protein 222-like [Hippocampus comes]